MMYSEQQHFLIQKLKELADELGRVPEAHEFTSRFPNVPIKILFGYYDRFVLAAGLQKKEPEKPETPIFDSLIDQLINFSTFQKPKTKIETSGKTTMVIGDAHFPFCRPEQIMRAAYFAEIIKPTNIVQLGDLYDFYALSKFPRSRNCYNPFEEVAIGKEMAKRFWAELRRASPKSFCYQLLGNHDERPHKRVLEACPDSEVFFSYKSCFDFEGVRTIWDLREELELDGRLYFHYRKNFGQNAAHFGKSCIFGHTHREQWKRSDFGNGSVFEYNVGLFGDPNAKELSYTPSKITHWSIGGIAVIDDFGARGLNESL